MILSSLQRVTQCHRASYSAYETVTVTVASRQIITSIPRKIFESRVSEWNDEVLNIARQKYE